MVFSDITFVTATFNNSTLTRCMIMSLWKKNIFPRILVIDNGSKDFFIASDTETKLGVSVVDNHFYNKTKDWGVGQLSKNHSNSLEYAISLVKTQWCVLCDNDILYKHNIMQFIDILNKTSCLVVGEVGYDAVAPNRLFPYLCAINMSLFRQYDIKYFDPARCMIPSIKSDGTKCNLYDTGYSFYADCLDRKVAINHIKLDDYIVHYLHGSQANNSPITISEWLTIHHDLL